MKILFVCEAVDRQSGWSTYTVELAEALRERGHSTVLFADLPPPFTFYTRPWRIFGVAKTLTKVIERERPDIIHMTVEPYALAYAWLPPNVRQRVVLTVHGSYGVQPLRRFLISGIMKRVYRELPQFITVSEYTKKRVHAELQKHDADIAASFAARAVAIPNGIRLPKWKPVTRIGTAHIIHVGGVKESKGAREALEGCAAYKEKGGKPFHLTYVGRMSDNSPYVSDLKRRAQELEMESMVTFAGLVSDAELETMYRQADLMLLPALTNDQSFEGFGLVFLEANAYGVPVIGPNDSGAVEAIAEGRSGFHVDPHKPADIAERMRWILEADKIQPELCRAWAEEHDIKNTAAAVEKVYQTVTV